MIAVSGCSVNVSHADNSFPVLQTGFITITQNIVFVLHIFIFVNFKLIWSNININNINMKAMTGANYLAKRWKSWGEK